MNPVNWFEIPATDLNRAKQFYEDVLGVALSLQDFGGLKMAWFPMSENASGATGTLVQQETYIPSHEGTMVYFAVESIDETLERVTSSGGRVLNGKTSIGEHGFVAHFEDSEGNRVALHARS
jgi:hypothetical protein